MGVIEIDYQVLPRDESKLQYGGRMEQATPKGDENAATD